MGEESKLFIRLINIAMGNYDEQCQCFEACEILNNNKDIWKMLYKLFGRHNLMSLLCENLNINDLQIPIEFRNDLMVKLALSVMQNAEQKEEAIQLMNIFEEKKIPVIMLKGWVMKELYPKPELRSMADLDIFMNIRDEYKVHDIMLARGYKCINFGYKKDNVYHRPEFLTIEMHKNLFKYEDDWNTFFENIWNRAIKLDNYNYVYQMDKELYYVYMLAHMAKHLMDDGGIGVRAFLDLWVYRKHYMDTLDYELIENDLCQLGLIKFETYAIKLSEIWFEQKEYTEPIYEEMADYIIQCGAYGNKEFFVMNNAAMAKATSRSKYLFRRAFPSRKEMELRFPKIKESPSLILYYWFLRLYKYGLKRKNEVEKEINSTRDIDYEKMAHIKKMYEEIGLSRKDDNV